MTKGNEKRSLISMWAVNTSTFNLISIFWVMRELKKKTPLYKYFNTLVKLEYN